MQTFDGGSRRQTDFSAARRPDDGTSLSGLDRERQLVKNGREVGSVLDLKVLDLQAARGWPRRRRARLDELRRLEW